MRRLLFPLALALLGVLVWLLLNEGDHQGSSGSTGNDPLPALTERAPALSASPVDLERAEAVPGPAAFSARPIITGSGKYGLVGKVVDEKGAPVASAWVAAWSSPLAVLDFEDSLTDLLRQPLRLDLDPLASALTDSEGGFSLVGTPGRTVYLSVRGDRRLTLRRTPVQPGAQDVLLRTVAGAALSGTVVDHGGQPVAGAELFVGPGLKYLLAALSANAIFLDRVVSDASGRFHFEAVPADQPLTAAALLGNREGGGVGFGPLEQGTHDQVRISFAAPGSLSGRVVDPVGAGVARVQVFAVPADLRRIIPFVRDPLAWSCFTDRDGNYRFGALPVGNCFLLGQHAMGRTALVSAKVDGDARAPDLLLGGVRMVEGRVITSDGNPVSGATVLSLSSPLRKKADSGSPTDRARDTEQFMQFAQAALAEILPQTVRTTTDENGGFQIPVPVRGTIRVEAEGLASTGDLEVPMLQGGEGSARRPLQGSDESKGSRSVLVVLYRPGAIEGIVIDGSARKPHQFFLASSQPEHASDDNDATHLAEEGELLLVGKRRVLRDVLSTHVIVDDPTGRFRIDGITPGTWTVKIKAAGYPEVEEGSVAVLEGETTQGIVISIDRGRTVEGRVVDAATGEGIAGALLQGASGGGFFGAVFGNGLLGESRTESDEEGRFTLTGLDASTGYIAAHHGDYTTGGAEIPEEDRPVQIELSRGGTLEGLVTGRRGDLLPDRIVVAIAPQRGGAAYQTVTDENGGYRIEHILPGSLMVVTGSLDDESLFSGSFDSMLQGMRMKTAIITEGKTTVLDIVDPSAGGCRFGGVVLDGNSPVANATLWAFASDREGLFDLRMSNAATNEAGEFLFESLAPGDYTVRVELSPRASNIDVFVPDILEDYQVLRLAEGQVSGRVISEHDGSPIPGAAVRLIREGHVSAIPFDRSSNSDSTSADENGQFLFVRVSPGRYHLEASGPEFNFRSELDALGYTQDTMEEEDWARAKERMDRLKRERASYGDAQSASFRLENGWQDGITLALPLPGTLLVRANDSQGAPVPSFRVVAVPILGSGETGGGEKGARAKDGVATLPGLSPASYRVTASARGFVDTAHEGVVVAGGSEAELLLILHRGAQLAVRVFGPDGNPTMNARTVVTDAQGRQIGNGFGLDQLAAQFFGENPGVRDYGTVAAGNYTVTASMDERTIEQTVSLAEGAEEIVELRF